jgi:hypothetical protein
MVVIFVLDNLVFSPTNALENSAKPVRRIKVFIGIRFKVANYKQR